MLVLAFAESIQLFPDGTIFLHIALILLMIWTLNRTFFRPINNVMAARERQKSTGSTEADDILKDVEAKESSYNRELLDARSAGYELIEKEQKKAASAHEKKIAELKTELAEKSVAEKAELEKNTAEARSAIGMEAEKMADKIAANILNAK